MGYLQPEIFPVLLLFHGLEAVDTPSTYMPGGSSACLADSGGVSLCIRVRHDFDRTSLIRGRFVFATAS